VSPEVDVAHLDDRTLLAVLFGEAEQELVDHLLEVFGGLVGVLAASASRLEAEARRRGSRLPFEGIRLEALREVTARSLKSRVRDRRRIASRTQLYGYLRASMGAGSREQMRILYLDQSLGLLADEAVTGTVDHAPFYPREVLRRALELEASKLILAHNHPSRSAKFSRQDVVATRSFQNAAEAVGIQLVDHLLVAGARIVSAANQGIVSVGQ